MRHMLAAAFATLIASSPAHATGGMLCSPVRGGGPVLSLVLGHGIMSSIVSATLRHGGETLTTGGSIATVGRRPMIVGQSWIDARELKVDLLDAQALRYEGQLRALFQPKLRERPAVGTLVRNGKSYRVRCVEA